MVYLLGYNHNQEPMKRVRGISFYQIFFCENGSGEVITDNTKFIVNKNQLFILPPNAPHEYHSLTEDWIVHFIGFNGTICSQLIHQLEMDKTVVYTIDDRSLFPDTITNMLEIYKHYDNFKLELSAKCYYLIINMANSLKPIVGKNDFKKNRIIDGVIAFIESNYQNNINLDDIADSCGISKEYMCYIFKKEMKQTIINFLCIERISHARKELLQYPDKKVYEVAESCGFQDPSYFGLVFKKIVGVSPEKFRRVR